MKEQGILSLCYTNDFTTPSVFSRSGTLTPSSNGMRHKLRRIMKDGIVSLR